MDPWHTSCEECGASVAPEQRDSHVCDEARRQLFQVRRELAGFEAEVAAFLASPAGLFEVWYAERQRLGFAA